MSARCIHPKCKSPNRCAARCVHPKAQECSSSKKLDRTRSCPQGCSGLGLVCVGLVVRCVVLVSSLSRGLSLVAEPQPPSGAVVC